MQFFKCTILFAILILNFEIAMASTDLGGLKGPLDSLGAISSLTESLQKGTPSKLGQLINENDCVRKIVMPDETPPLQAGDMKVARFSIDVSGAGCPVLYHVSLEGAQGADAFNGLIKFSYVAQSQEARGLYDVEKFDFNGTFSAKVFQVPNGGGMEFTFDYTGNGNSKTKGPFTADAGMKGKMTMSMGGAPSSPSAAPGIPSLNLKLDGAFGEHMRFSFQNESADLASNTTLSGFSPTAEFKINGQVVSAADYKNVRDKIKLPGMEANPLNVSQPGASVLACKTEVYRAAEFSQAQAEQWTISGGVKPAPLKTSQTCGGSARDAASVDGKNFAATFTSDPAHTSVRVDLCIPGGACDSTERAFLPDEDATYVDTLLQSYTVVTSCAVVPACAP